MLSCGASRTTHFARLILSKEKHTSFIYGLRRPSPQLKPSLRTTELCMSARRASVVLSVLRKHTQTRWMRVAGSLKRTGGRRVGTCQVQPYRLHDSWASYLLPVQYGHHTHGLLIGDKTTGCSGMASLATSQRRCSFVFSGAQCWKKGDIARPNLATPTRDGHAYVDGRSSLSRLTLHPYSSCISHSPAACIAFAAEHRSFSFK